jgi:glycosyltransferase involved in cell wall biosynthesis
MITVACLMPTIPAHEPFLQSAMDSIHSQQYPKGWDVILHVDGDPDLTLGAKLNKMLDSISALPVDFVVLTDSDDIHHPTRVHRQIQPLLDNPKLMLSGTSTIVYRDICTNEVHRYTGNVATWLGGLAFTVGAWKAHRFEDISAGTDTRWQKLFAPQSRLDLRDESLMLCSIHSANTSKKHTVGREWQQLPCVPDTLRGLCDECC